MRSATVCLVTGVLEPFYFLWSSSPKNGLCCPHMILFFFLALLDLLNAFLGGHAPKLYVSPNHQAHWLMGENKGATLATRRPLAKFYLLDQSVYLPKPSERVQMPETHSVE